MLLQSRSGVNNDFDPNRCGHQAKAYWPQTELRERQSHYDCCIDVVRRRVTVQTVFHYHHASSHYGFSYMGTTNVNEQREFPSKR
jgi:hypothetical protein